MLEASSDGVERSERRKGSLRDEPTKATAKQETVFGPFSVERAKRGASSDDPDGAKPQSSVGLRADGAEQTRETWRRSPEQHGCSEPPKPDGAGRPFTGKPSGSKSGDRGVGGNTGSPIAFRGPDSRGNEVRVGLTGRICGCAQ